MTTWGLMRGFFAFLLAGIIAFAVYTKNDEKEPVFGKPKRYAPIVPPFLLPTFLIALFIAGLFVIGRERTVSLLLDCLFPVGLHIGVYCAVLLLLLPLLRKWISAGACALLWLMPNYLYLAYQSFMKPNEPLFVLRVKPETVRILLIVWAAGFIGVLLWKIIGHLRFRRQLLKSAVPVTDGDTLAQWESAQRRMEMKKPRYKLLRSNEITSPLSVGLFWFTLRVVLPDAAYSRDELELIFRHELIHVQRDDCWTKFFLVFCTALNWFNPLMWIAMRRSAEDLELSCDESVLEFAGDAERRCYADLILRSAGDGRGFTTCLSASASALRYRLKSIMQPRRRFTGAIVTGVLFFAMVITCGYAALAFGGDTAGEALLTPYGIDSSTVAEGVTRSHGSRYRSCICTDEEALLDYIAALPVYEITGSYSWETEDGSNGLYLMYSMKELSLSDHNIQIMDFAARLNKKSNYTQNYYIHEEIDWDYIDTLLSESPVEYVELAEPPELILNFGEPANGIHAIGKILCKTVNGEVKDLSYLVEDRGVGGIQNFAVTEVELGFPILPTEFSVRVDAFDGSDSYFESGDAIAENGYILSLAPYDAHYTVSASFQFSDGDAEKEYEMQYRFDVELPE